tara:strand:- start:655 stop:876 length:222 start_codon:yes stop_codon:yes gene_type:complete
MGIPAKISLLYQYFETYTIGDKPVAVNNISFPTKKDGWNNNNDHKPKLSKSVGYLKKGKKRADGDPNAKTWLP